ncbi:hydroxymethylglutaryl-CoA lyase [Rhodococcus opacus]|uniref:hydroxymethylglutaryl-CoA lyase n=1 Tax=Rhodococcus opacus TaxID=37919 RepID=UPI001C44F604|nr:hydroxymethylglutaryl-CoA lyase [Rhodococcus opacus]MBV6761351.1 hydroxymethylglutaryl-CoA lyase [Rhodococcus opacus]
MTTPANPDPVWRPAPHEFADPSLPSAVRIYEVGPRDGLQAESTLVPTAVKAEFCRRLVAAGVQSLEVTSFVSPKWIPQLADAESLMAELDLPDTVRQVVLAPNQRGLERALTAGAREIAVFVSATETFARKNLNTTVAGALGNARPVVEGAHAAGIETRGYISMCFGDPWEGRVDPGRVAAVAAELAGMGCTSISLGDTIGVATPGHVRAVLDAVQAVGVPIGSIAGHFHDTYGQALANVHAALIAGVTEFDTAAGGLGRCPYAKGATGNLATEDLVWMLHGLGIHTGIDLDTLTDTSHWMAGHVGHPSPSRVATALTAARS